jgi:hypothetical protein
VVVKEVQLRGDCTLAVGAKSAWLSTPRLPPKTTDRYPQKSPHQPGYTSRPITQVLTFDGVEEMWEV